MTSVDQTKQVVRFHFCATQILIIKLFEESWTQQKSADLEYRLRKRKRLIDNNCGHTIFSPDLGCRLYVSVRSWTVKSQS